MLSTQAQSQTNQFAETLVQALARNNQLLQKILSNTQATRLNLEQSQQMFMVKQTHQELTIPTSVYNQSLFRPCSLQQQLNILPQQLPEPFDQNTLGKVCEITSEWLTSSLDTICQTTFQRSYSKNISDEECKVIMARLIIENFEYFARVLDKKGIWSDYSERMIKHYESSLLKTLDFLMLKYPLKKKTPITKEMKALIAQKNSSSNLQYDLLTSNGFFFGKAGDLKGHCKVVKLFLNKLIQSARDYQPFFNEQMQKVFTVRDGNSSTELKGLMGIKFKQSTQLFTQQEMQQEGIQVKSPQMLRVLTKWIEGLEQTITNMKTTGINNQYCKKGQKYPTLLSKHSKSLCREFIKNSYWRFEQAGKEMKSRIQAFMSLSPQFVSAYSPLLGHIPSRELKVNLFSYGLSEIVSNLTVNYLLFLIDFLQEMSEYIFEMPTQQKNQQVLVEDYMIQKNERRDRMSILRGLSTSMRFSQSFSGSFIKQSQLQFASFLISDILRCKCSGTLQQVKEMYRNLEDMQDQNFKIYRVKNRLNRSTKDFLINFQVKHNNSMLLCEVQLAVTDKEMSYKEKTLNHFSHILYELSRTKYGPIGQAVYIYTSLTQYNPYMHSQLLKLHIKDRAQERTKDLKIELVRTQSEAKPYRIVVQGYRQRNNFLSFVCYCCLELKIANQNYDSCFDSSSSVLDISNKAQMEEIKDNKTSKSICMDCILSIGGDNVQKQYLLNGTKSELKEVYEQSCNILAVSKRCCRRQVEIFKKAYQKINTPSYIAIFRSLSEPQLSLTFDKIRENYFSFQIIPQIYSQIVSWMVPQKVFKAGRPGGSLTAQLYAPNNPRKQAIKANIAKQFAKINEKYLQNKYDSHRLSSDEDYLEIMLSLIALKQAQLKDQQFLSRLKGLRTISETQIEFMNLQQKDKNIEMPKENLEDRSFLYSIDGSKSLQKLSLHYVRYFNLQNNRISTIEFARCPRLVYLNLQNNRIHSISLTDSCFPELNTLCLFNNPICKYNVLSHPKLQRLQLGLDGEPDNLRDIYSSLWQTPQLKQLKLGGEFTEIKMQFVKFSKLSRLEFSSCSISDNGIFEQNNIETIVFQGCRSQTLNLSRWNLKKLKRLSFGQSNIHKLTLPSLTSNKELVELESVKSLILSSQSPIFENGVATLKELGLGKGNTKSSPLIQSTLKSSTQLSILCLSNIQLDSLNLSMLKTKSLKSLFLLESVRINNELKIPADSVLEKIVLKEMQCRALKFELGSDATLKQLTVEYSKISEIILPKQMRKATKLTLRNIQVQRLKLQKMRLPSVDELEIVVRWHQKAQPNTMSFEFLRPTKILIQSSNTVGLQFQSLDTQHCQIQCPKLQEFNIPIESLQRLKKLIINNRTVQQNYRYSSQLSSALKIDQAELKEVAISIGKLELQGILTCNMENLAFLSLKNCDLINFQLPKHLRHLTRLNLAHNSLRTLDLSHSNLDKLELLDLSFNKFKSLDNELSQNQGIVMGQQYKQFRVLQLSYNQLRSVKLKCKMPLLKYVNVSNNKIEIMELQGGLQSLTQLIASFNRNMMLRLKSFPPKLRSLNLDYNHSASTVQQAIERMMTLSEATELEKFSVRCMDSSAELGETIRQLIGKFLKAPKLEDINVQGAKLNHMIQSIVDSAANLGEMLEVDQGVVYEIKYWLEGGEEIQTESSLSEQVVKVVGSLVDKKLVSSIIEEQLVKQLKGNEQPDN